MPASFASHQPASARALAPADQAGGPAPDAPVRRDGVQDGVERGYGRPPADAAENAEKKRPAVSKELTPEEQEVIEKLKKRDAEVRRHEQAHLMAAGPYGKGPPNYSYQTGPDGKRYAIGGHVYIDTRPVEGDPRATIQKARIVHRAALAPQDPSNQDRSVAAEAKALEAKARRQLAQEHAPMLDEAMQGGEAVQGSPSADGPSADGPSADGPSADGPSADGTTPAEGATAAARTPANRPQHRPSKAPAIDMSASRGLAQLSAEAMTQYAYLEQRTRQEQQSAAATLAAPDAFQREQTGAYIFPAMYAGEHAQRSTPSRFVDRYA